MLLVEGAFPVRFERCYWLDANGRSSNKIVLFSAEINSLTDGITL